MAAGDLTGTRRGAGSEDELKIYRREQPDYKLFTAEVPYGAQCMVIGPLERLDDAITAIDWDTKTFTTLRTEGTHPFPAQWYRPEDVVWTAAPNRT